LTRAAPSLRPIVPRIRHVPATLDTIRSVATPEGVELDLRLAGPVARAYAWGIDFALRALIMLALSLALMPLGGFGGGLLLLTWFFLEWLFPAVCEAFFNGATPGKKLLGLQVVNDDGTPVAWGAAFTRNLLRAVDFLPLFYCAGFVAMLMSREFKRLGDVVAATLVIYRDTAHRRAVIPPTPPRAPGVPLTLAESRALLDYAERAGSLTPQRAEELAEIPARLTGGAQGQVARERLLQMANYLVGHRAR
jgi:uncharacterized RDD family membrane protein YckC